MFVETNDTKRISYFNIKKRGLLTARVLKEIN